MEENYSDCPQCGNSVFDYEDVCPGCGWARFETEVKQKFGYLRQDNDSHWYLVPEDLVKRFDYALRVIGDDDMTVSEEDDLINLFISEFDTYRLSGGPYDLKISLDNIAKQ